MPGDTVQTSGSRAPAPPAASAAAPGERVRRWLHEELPRWIQRTFFEPPLAPVAVEVDPSHLLLAVARREKREARPRVAHLRARPLPEGLLRPSVLQPNVADPAALAAEVRALFDALEAPRGLSVLLPDAATKVAILDLDKLPPSRREALELVRFRLKKTVPFRIDDALVDFQPLRAAAGKMRLLTAVASRQVVEQYAAAFEALGAQPGLMTLSTLALAERALPPASAPDSGDVLLANVTPHALTLSVFRGGDMVLFRSKGLAGPREADPEERRLAARREWQATVAYYQEKLAGRGFSRALARLVGWKAPDLLDAEDVERLEAVRVDGWAEPAPGLAPPAGDGTLFAPALALALRGVS